jgi:hypothetical protein
VNLVRRPDGIHVSPCALIEPKDNEHEPPCTRETDLYGLGNEWVRLGSCWDGGIQHSVKYTETTPARGYELAPVRQSDMVHVD